MVQITFDREAALIESGLPLQLSRHRVIPSEYADWANRVTRRDDLFMYYHRVRETYVLAGWIVPGKACTELTVMEIPPGHFDSTPPCFEVLKYLVQPPEEKAKAAIESVKAARSMRDSLKRDSAASRLDMARHLLKHGKPGGENLAAGVPFFGDREGGDHLASTKDQLITEAKLSDRKSGPWYDHLKPARPE